MIIYDIRETQHLNPIIEFTPMNCFVGQRDPIPGIEGDYFPVQN